MSKKERNSRNNTKGKKNKSVTKVLIVTLGEETEPKYFNYFKNRINNLQTAKVDIKKNKKSPTYILKKMCDSQSDLIKSENIWGVFDKDSFDDFNKTIIDCTEKGYKVAWSNPCFEIWFLMHFNLYNNSMTTSSVIEKTKEVFKQTYNIDYEKNNENLFELLESKLHIAKSNSNKRKEYCKEEIKNKNFDKMNPCTNVDELVSFLEKFI